MQEYFAEHPTAKQVHGGGGGGGGSGGGGGGGGGVSIPAVITVDSLREDEEEKCREYLVRVYLKHKAADSLIKTLQKFQDTSRTRNPLKVELQLHVLAAAVETIASQRKVPDATTRHGIPELMLQKHSINPSRYSASKFEKVKTVLNFWARQEQNYGLTYEQLKELEAPPDLAFLRGASAVPAAPEAPAAIVPTFATEEGTGGATSGRDESGSSCDSESDEESDDEGTSQQRTPSKTPWTTAEDAELRKMVLTEGAGKWTAKAKRFKTTTRSESALRHRWEVLVESDKVSDSEDESSGEENSAAAGNPLVSAAPGQQDDPQPKRQLDSHNPVGVKGLAGALAGGSGGSGAGGSVGGGVSICAIESLGEDEEEKCREYLVRVYLKHKAADSLIKTLQKFQDTSRTRNPLKVELQLHVLAAAVETIASQRKVPDATTRHGIPELMLQKHSINPSRYSASKFEKVKTVLNFWARQEQNYGLTYEQLKELEAPPDLAFLRGASAVPAAPEAPALMPPPPLQAARTLRPRPATTQAGGPIEPVIIADKDVQLLVKLSDAGSFSTVYSGMFRNQVVAVKLVNEVNNIAEKVKQDSFKKEWEALKNCSRK